MINDRISILTDGMIKNFLPSYSLTGATVFSMINAIYLNAQWYQDELFQQSLPFQPMAFRLEGGKLKNLTMFAGTVKAPYLEHDRFQLIKLPMKGHYHLEFGMYIVLPTIKNGTKFLSPLETFVKNDLLNKILNIKELKSEYVRVTIPEIAFEYEDDLVDDLKSLGIKDIFQRGRGDFSRITNSNARSLYVEEFRQKLAIG
uniref:Serpin domain-containing protein n=1 Tax=Romanomermis culicivorax TaxID=13658 RepID=A0A915KF42_ROMCU